MSEDIVGVEQRWSDAQVREAIRAAKIKAETLLGIGWHNLEEISRVELILENLPTTLTPEPSAAVDLEGGSDEIGWLIEQHMIDIVYAKLTAETWPRLNVVSHHKRCDLEEYRSPISFTNDASEALRFARKADADAFVAVFGRFLLRPLVAEHSWPGEPAAAHTNRGEVERLREAGSVIESMARAVHASTGATMSWEDDADQEACVRAVVAMFKGAVPLPEHVVDNCDGNNADVQYEWRQIVAAILDEPKARAALSSPDTVKDVSDA